MEKQKKTLKISLKTAISILLLFISILAIGISYFYKNANMQINSKPIVPSIVKPIYIEKNALNENLNFKYI